MTAFLYLLIIGVTAIVVGFIGWDQRLRLSDWCRGAWFFPSAFASWRKEIRRARRYVSRHSTPPSLMKAWRLL